MSKTITAQAITGGNLFIDGIGRLGELKGAELPKFEHNTIEANSQVGKYEVVLPTLKPLNAKFTVNNVSSSYFKLLDVSKKQNIYIKKNLSSTDGEHTGITVTFEGSVKLLETPNFEMDKEVELSFEMSCTLVKYEVNKATALLYDVENAVYEVNGNDLYEFIRKNIM